MAPRDVREWLGGRHEVNLCQIPSLWEHHPQGMAVQALSGAFQCCRGLPQALEKGDTPLLGILISLSSAFLLGSPS